MTEAQKVRKLAKAQKNCTKAMKYLESARALGMRHVSDKDCELIAAKSEQVLHLSAKIRDHSWATTGISN